MFAQRLKYLREREGLSQYYMAEILAISVSGYAFYEKGRNEPSIQNIIKLAKFFDVSSDYLLGISDIENTSFSNKKDYKQIIYSYAELNQNLKNQFLIGCNYYLFLEAEYRLENIKQTEQKLSSDITVIYREMLDKIEKALSQTSPRTEYEP